MRYLLCLLFLGIGNILFAQDDDESFNLQSFTPSALLQKQQIELKIFNNLYTQTQGFDEHRVRNMQGSRSNYLGNFVQGLYGINSRLNVGFDLYVRSTSTTSEDSHAFAIFQAGDLQRTAVTKIGPRIKFLPFKKYRRLSFQSTFLFPTAPNLEGVNDNNAPWLDWDTYTWLNQIFWDKSLSQKWQVFTALEMFLRIPRESYSEEPLFSTPVKAFVSYFPTTKITTYAMVEWGPTWGTDPLLSNYYSQIGIGGKYQLNTHLELEALFTTFPLGKSQGAGQTYNIGIRYLR
ncbi:MAG: hypothetical protein GY827_09020 [Cytophagales bacterium]|nr:hypothetical protein [Cytophagales bacterium]